MGTIACHMFVIEILIYTIDINDNREKDILMSIYAMDSTSVCFTS